MEIPIQQGALRMGTLGTLGTIFRRCYTLMRVRSHARVTLYIGGNSAHTAHTAQPSWQASGGSPVHQGCQPQSISHACDPGTKMT